MIKPAWYLLSIQFYVKLNKTREMREIRPVWSRTIQKDLICPKNVPDGIVCERNAPNGNVTDGNVKFDI